MMRHHKSISIQELIRVTPFSYFSLKLNVTILKL